MFRCLSLNHCNDLAQFFSKRELPWKKISMEVEDYLIIRRRRPKKTAKQWVCFFVQGVGWMGGSRTVDRAWSSINLDRCAATLPLGSARRPMHGILLALNIRILVILPLTMLMSFMKLKNM